MGNQETQQEQKQPRRMEVWYAKLPQRNDSSVQGGGRPVLVLSNDISNSVSSVVTVLPMTSRPKRLDLPSHTWVDADHFDGLRTGALILAEQITAIDQKQLVFRMGICNDEDAIRRIEGSVNEHLGLDGKEIRKHDRQHNESCEDKAGLFAGPSQMGRQRTH